MEQWCGDMNGLAPCMPEEERRRISSEAWASVESLQLSVLSDRNMAAMPQELHPAAMTIDALREVIDALMDSETWWKSFVPAARLTSPPTGQGTGDWPRECGSLPESERGHARRDSAPGLPESGAWVPTL